MVQSAEEAEVSYYSDQSGVRVTDKRVIIGNTTYSMANITSISTHVEKPSLIGPILFMLIGAVLLVAGIAEARQSGGMAVAGLITGVLGYFWYRGCKPVSHLRIASASGESTPLKSVNKDWIGGIARAINEAMIRRA
jgi:uncharacterized protein DUF6232